MKLSTKGRYGVIAMLDIAVYSTQDNYISLHSIAERNSISISYLEQLFIKLKKHDLVVSAKGPKGGYRLKVLPSEIYISAIINAVDENISFMGCNPTKVCTKGKRCNSHDLWHYLMDKLYHYLDNISLETVINRDFLLLNNTLAQKNIESS